MKIIVIRHGETDYNKNGIVQGISDIELNNEGRNQALSLGIQLQTIPIDRIITSPLKRAYETAMLLGIDCPITIDERLQERGLGNYEGRPSSQYDYEKYGNFLLNSKDNGVESVQDTMKRLFSVLDELEEKYPEETVALVSHGGLLRFMPYYMGKIPEDGVLEHKILGNASWAIYEIRKEEKYENIIS